ncbi:FAD-dependent monooxygenase [Glycomyces sp. L485]|uniref:FAD-dependent monooxygenase n=1 Tax=Glycomyces sp. L485 TaxID=2909235 RepID=UPI001F4A825B|nr:FAD-dependent monooxygenase [Glycomyces sp. L485]MCH7233072.1 FAD-dependent monooxygenase [Glycomyces sp. L485]
MSHTAVLIVGAGPTGLALACELARRGVDFRIIDEHAGPQPLTKAAALHARALEYLSDFDAAERVLGEGHRVDLLQLRTGHRDRLGVDFRVLEGETAFPHMIDLPQHRTEQILLDRLRELGASPDRETALTGLSTRSDSVQATLRGPNGTETVDADYLIGSDGVRSTVRESTGLAYEGADYADPWVLCDAVIDWPLPRNEMTFSADTDGIFGVFPLPGTGAYRIAYTQRRTASGEPIEPSIADAQAAMSRTGVEGTIRSAGQFSTFSLAHKQAPRYQVGRVLLAGDAGHVHTPFGGQGLNLGIGDAANLGWKLAEVCAGRAPATLLDTYEPERHRVARQVVRMTHLGAEAMLLRADPRRHVRDAVFGILRGTPYARALAARRLSQLAHSYRGSGGAVLGGAGDRLPDPPIFDGVQGIDTRLHRIASSERHTLLMTGMDASELPRAADIDARLRGDWETPVDTVVLTDDWRARTSAPEGVRIVLDRERQAGPLHTGHPRAVLVRPDHHTGYEGPVDYVRISEYMGLTSLARK